jgi:RNA polymerase sigma-70 factor (ECF subfamily)
MQNKTDEELMEMLKSSNAEAFSTLVRRHARYYYNVAYRIVLDRETAEDIVQNCYLKIWEKPGLWVADKAKFKTWFYRIICNAAIDDKRRLRPVALDFDIEDNQEAQDLTEENLLHTALKSIPARQRAAIM